MLGYPESLTDPSYKGQILVLTYPLIGNYGCAPRFNASKNVWLAGLVIKEKTRIFSNWQAKSSFDDFIKRHNLLTISEVDTRTLAVHLRNKGQMLGIISTNGFTPKELLGKILVHKTKEGICKGKIVETEAYLGKNDPVSIGCRKVKNMPKSLLKGPGHAFVYFTYGNHWMFNVVAKKPGIFGAVLIRALEPLKGTDLMKKRRVINDIKNLTSGPGKLTKAIGIDKRHDGLDLTKDVLFIENSYKKYEIVKTTRIGLSAGEDLQLRFYIKDNDFVSKK
jgi:DNA-3-methyladenine glycosylase